MKPRVCFSAATPPLGVQEFGAPPADSPALRRLISVALGALALWGCWSLASSILGSEHLRESKVPLKVVTDAQTRHSSTPSLAPVHVERAELVEALPVLKRALPVVGAHYPATLPEGQLVTTTWKGTVADFSDLPKNPALGDEFGVPRSGHSWIWATPYGWSHPAWIDP
jgi:hypothetical protein